MADIQKFGYELEEAAKVSSVGESLDIIKDVGSAHDVDHTYHVKNLRARMASAMSASPPSPTWRLKPRTRSGRPAFADVAIVHNGQITNYYKLRRRFEKRGYKFQHRQRQPS